MAKIRPVSHEDRLTVVEHLDELRWRLILSLATFTVAFAFCFWQNHFILDLLDEPLPGDQRPLTLAVAGIEGGRSVARGSPLRVSAEPVRSGWGSTGAVVLLATFERWVPVVTFGDGPAALGKAITAA